MPCAALREGASDDAPDNELSPERKFGDADPALIPVKYRCKEPPTLSDAGIDKKFSSRAQQFAALPEKNPPGLRPVG